MNITATTRFRRENHVLKQEAGGTVVLLRVDDGQYYSLNEVGGRCWDLCDGERTVSEIAAVIGHEFDAPVATIDRDLFELLTDLAHEKLVVETS